MVRDRYIVLLDIARNRLGKVGSDLVDHLIAVQTCVQVAGFLQCGRGLSRGMAEEQIAGITDFRQLPDGL